MAGSGGPPEDPTRLLPADPALPSGPIPLPRGHRPRDPRWAWVVSLAVVVLGLAVYYVTRPPSVAGLQRSATPAWGSLTLTHVALGVASAAGDAHPQDAVWLSAARPAVLQALGAPPETSADAEFVVALQGQFRAAPAAAQPLAGSAAAGAYLVVLVRAFDGTLSGALVTSTDPNPALGRIAILHPLRLFRF